MMIESAVVSNPVAPDVKMRKLPNRNPSFEDYDSKKSKFAPKRPQRQTSDASKTELLCTSIRTHNVATCAIPTGTSTTSVLCTSTEISREEVRKDLDRAESVLATMEEQRAKYMDLIKAANKRNSRMSIRTNNNESESTISHHESELEKQQQQQVDDATSTTTTESEPVASHALQQQNSETVKHLEAGETDSESAKRVASVESTTSNQQQEKPKIEDLRLQMHRATSKRNMLMRRMNSFRKSKPPIPAPSRSSFCAPRKPIRQSSKPDITEEDINMLSSTRSLDTESSTVTSKTSLSTATTIDDGSEDESCNSRLAALRAKSAQGFKHSNAVDGSRRSQLSSQNRRPRMSKAASFRFMKSTATNQDTKDMEKTVQKGRMVQRSVSFDEVQLRLYERVLSDNPTRSKGPSIGLGWKYEAEVHIDIEDWENQRMGHRRKRTQLIMSGKTREKIALSLGYTNKDLRDNIRGQTKLKQRRSRTAQNSNLEDKIDLSEQIDKIGLAVECAQRKVDMLLKKNN